MRRRRVVLGLGAIVVLLAAAVLVASFGSGGTRGNRSRAVPPIAGSAGSSKAEADSAGGSAATSGGGAAPADLSAIPASAWDQRIIRTAELDLQVTDVEQVVAFARTTASANGGQVLTSTSAYEDDVQTASMTIEVPSAQFDSVMTALRSSSLVAKVERETTSSQDVTEEYVDLQARQRNLEASEDRYRSLMAQATRMEDILALERELSRVRGEIEQVKGRLNFLERRTSYSRIDLTLRPVGAAGAAKSGVFEPLGAAERAWNASMRFVGTVLEAGVTAVVFLWWLWPLALAGGAVYYARRGRRGEENAAPPGA